jgi:hypothetical protein
MTMTAPERNPDHDRVASGINHAIAYRLLFNFLQARERAKQQGANVADLPDISWPVVDDHYRKLIDEWLPEAPDTITSARAFVDLATVILLDKTASELFSIGTIGGDEKDHDIAVRALMAVGEWLDKSEIAEAGRARP